MRGQVHAYGPHHGLVQARYNNAEQLTPAGPRKVVSTSGKQVIDEWLRPDQNVGRTAEGRLVYE